MSKVKRLFKKGYIVNWSGEFFTIRDAHPSTPPMYRLTDDRGELLDGTFYKWEVQNVSVPKDKLYRVEMVHQRCKVGKTAQVLLKWYNCPASFNSWIDAKVLVEV